MIIPWTRILVYATVAASIGYIGYTIYGHIYKSGYDAGHKVAFDSQQTIINARQKQIDDYKQNEAKAVTAKNDQVTSIQARLSVTTETNKMLARMATDYRDSLSRAYESRQSETMCFDTDGVQTINRIVRGQNK